ncbi:heavy metal-associated isoprenylated plant protein 21-like [Magnolia sinica]|uniref:heavy metal-associated isoprenylated plant protein 21-like n=1 Tax=Magnolia sinica TaxID=86752 RepID=UPI002657FE22|nr:heavy metal-associated isoprenylated plant protein 21-like [Magnolia sinica]
MGVLDHLSEICTVDNKSIRNKRRPWQTVEVKVKMDCDGCERRVRHAVCSMKGARTVDVNRKQSKVTVTGYVDQNKVIKRIKGVGKKAEPWPYVEYKLVTYPYVHQAYDKKAPSGYVRNVVQALPSPNNPVEKYTYLFNDENPHACTIM